MWIKLGSKCVCVDDNDEKALLEQLQQQIPGVSLEDMQIVLDFKRKCKLKNEELKGKGENH